MTHEMFEQIVAARQVLTSLSLEHWKAHDMFSLQWWFLLIIMVLPWVVWWRLVDHKRVLEIFVFGMLCLNGSALLDALGVEHGLWGYPHRLFPIVPGLISGEFGIATVGQMLIYQYCPRWKSFMVGTVLLSAWFSFIGEPILKWMTIYELYRWNYFYSFPVYIVITVFSRWLVTAIKRRDWERNAET